MRGEDHVVEGVERVVGFRRLNLLDVEACACNLVLFKRFDQSRLIDESTSPASKDAFKQAAPAGSTAMTLIFGFKSFARVETPVQSPPPPTGTRI